MPSVELQINALEEKYGQIFESVRTESYRSTKVLNELIRTKETVYVYRPECLIDVNSDNTYEMLQKFKKAANSVILAENMENENTSIIEFIMVTLYSKYEEEKRIGNLN